MMLEFSWMLSWAQGAQVGLEEFWFGGNLCRALKGGSRKGQLMGSAWISLGLQHPSTFCCSEMCEFCSVFVGKRVQNTSRLFWGHLWQMTAFPKHTNPGQFIWAGAGKVLPAEHTAVNIIRPWLKDNWSHLDFDCEFCVSHCVVVVMISNYFYSVFKPGSIPMLH